MQTAVVQDTQTKLDTLCDLQPMKFQEQQWRYVVRSPCQELGLERYQESHPVSNIQ